MPILPAMDSLTTDTFSIDHEALIHFRRDRLRAQMVSHGVDACLLFDPINMRYATGARNMQIFHQRNPSRYLFLPVEGPVVLFEFTGGHHLAIGLSTIDEVRPATTEEMEAAEQLLAEDTEYLAADVPNVTPASLLRGPSRADS